MPRAQRGDGCAPPRRWEQERGSAPQTGTRSTTLTVVQGGQGAGDTRHRGHGTEGPSSGSGGSRGPAVPWVRAAGVGCAEHRARDVPACCAETCLAGAAPHRNTLPIWQGTLLFRHEETRNC